MRVFTCLAASMAVAFFAANARSAEPKIERATIEGARAVFSGTLDLDHQLVFRIENGPASVEWRSDPATKFQISFEASDMLDPEEGFVGNGFFASLFLTQDNRVRAERIMGPLFEGCPIVGVYANRDEADFVTKDGLVTFGDVTRSAGAKLPVSLRIERKKP